MEMSARSKYNEYENETDIYTGLILPDNNECSTLKPNLNPFPEAQKTAKSRQRCSPYKVATVCLGLLCAFLVIGITILFVYYPGLDEKHPGIAPWTPTPSDATALRAVQTLSPGPGLDEKHPGIAPWTPTPSDATALRAVETLSPVEHVKPKVCPPKWIGFKTSCYYFSTDSRSWEDSQKYCVERGGHLPIIHTREEQTFLFNQLVRGYWNPYWFGISDEKAEGDWFWVDGTKLVGGFWMDGEPNNHIDEDCGYMVKNGDKRIPALRSWNDAPCSSQWRWICEAPIG